MTAILNDIETAARALRSGELVAIPTETVYGLAASALDDAAVRQVYALKKRPENHPLIMHVAPEWDLTQWVDAIPDYAVKLMEQFWPGPLTLVFPYRANSTSSLLTGGQDSIALRAPNHPVALALLRRLQIPLVAPSANPFGKISPTCTKHVQESFPDAPLRILEGGRCKVGIESTIVSALKTHPGQILRPGILSAAQIEAVTGLPSLKKASKTRVPGKMPKHYEPDKPLFYFESEAALIAYLKQTDSSVFVLHPKPLENHPPELFLAFPASPSKAAWAFYDSLRTADASAASCIAMVLPERSPASEGLRERIRKAGQEIST